MALRPGSFLWFFANDMRLSARGFEAQFRGLSRPKIAAILVVAVIGMHALAWPAARWLEAVAQAPGGEARVEAWFAGGVAASLSLIVSQSMTSAMRTLYARGDFELILASPVSSRSVLGSRALAIAFEAAASGAMLLLPLANMGVLLGRPRWLAIYPALLSSTLAGAGAGLLLAMTFFLNFGPRRARALSQVAATLLGASFILTVQALGMLPAGTREAVIEAFSHPAPGSWLDHNGMLWLPVRAALGEPFAMMVWLLVGIASFLLAIFICGRRIADVAALGASASFGVRREGSQRLFRGGVGAALRTKERKLVLRDPWLLSQILLQIIYTLPVSVVLWRNGGVTGSAGVAFAPSIVIVAAQLSGTLAWVALSAEDAPDFLATAPVTRGEVERRKIEAIALPIGMLLAIPLVGLAFASPWGAICAFLFALGAGVSTAIINLWRQAPARRNMALRRHAQSKLVGLIEHLITLLWAVACAIAIMGSWTALAPVALAGFVLWINRPRGERTRTPLLPGAGRTALTGARGS